MKITTCPKPEMFGNTITIDPCELEIITFYGDCHAVRLATRDKNDQHVMFQIMTEDDGHWFYSNICPSSYWLPEIIKLLQKAEKWMKANCKPDIYKGNQFGWKTR